MNLKNINNNENEDISPSINNGGELPLYEELKYHFNKDDKIQPLLRTLKNNKELKLIPYTFKELKLANIGDMSVWVIYLNGEGVKNPYYANDFEPYGT